MDILSLLSDVFSWLPFGDNLFTLLMFVIVLSVLVFVHEWGHYAAAKSVGIHADAFSIGFGKELWGRVDKAGTRWKICLIPLGGYVQMKGEGGKTNKEAPKDAYNSKTVLQRMWVVFAGPLANFVFALVVLCVLMIAGEQRSLPKVDSVEAGMPAEIAGMQQGDIIRVIDDITVEDWEHVRTLISDRAEKNVHILVEREGHLIPLKLTPSKVEYTNLFGETKMVGRIGALPTGDTFIQKRSIGAAIERGAEKTWEIFAGTVKGVGMLITGAVGADNLSGPIGIAKMAGDTAELGTYSLLMFMVIISINLGLINLFPIPVLDGGHLLLLSLEAILRKPVPEIMQEWMFRTGFAFILFLIAFSTVNDLSRVSMVQKFLDSVQSDTQAESETPSE